MTRAAAQVPPPAVARSGQPSPGPDPVLLVEVDRSRTQPVIVVSGELDAAGEPLLAAVLEHVAAGDERPVAVDLSAVPYADTHGLAPVLRAGVVVVAASPIVRRLLQALDRRPARSLLPRPVARTGRNGSGGQR